MPHAIDTSITGKYVTPLYTKRFSIKEIHKTKGVFLLDLCYIVKYLPSFYFF